MYLRSRLLTVHCVWLCSVDILVLKDGGDEENINDYELAPELRRLLPVSFRKQGLAVLRSNGIQTAQDWLTAKKLTPLKLRTDCGAALVGYLDELAGVRSPGAPTIRALRFFLALL